MHLIVVSNHVTLGHPGLTTTHVKVSIFVEQEHKVINVYNTLAPCDHLTPTFMS